VKQTALKERVGTFSLVMDRAQELSFKLEPLERTLAEVPDKPTRVGDWMVYRPTKEELPTRAKQRVMEMLEAGIRPVDLVLYHEIKEPGFIEARLSPAVKATGSRLATWASQDVPVMTEKAWEVTKKHGPTLLGMVVAGIAVVATLLLVGLAYTALAVVSAIVSDPVLVIVTEDGYWIEIDRWYS
jgi:hypothetical protein